MKLLLMRPQSKLKDIIPMGLIYIAGYLREKVHNTEINILDLRQTNLKEKKISDIIDSISPDIVGISAVNMEGDSVHSLASIVKRVRTNTKIILGGPYSTSMFGTALKDDNIFCCVLREGEETMFNLLTAIRNGTNLKNLNGIAYRTGEKIVENPAATFIDNLDSIPIPAYDLVEMTKYFRSFGTHAGTQFHHKYTSIFTSRGCPFKCIYCHDFFGKKIRFHSADRVVEEILLLHNKYGIEEIHFEDDSFNINKERVKRIFTLLKSTNVKMKFAFPNGIRADIVNDELLDLFKDVGVYRLAYGIESGSVNIQKKIGKNLNIEKARRNIQLTTKRGISTHGFFMLGFLNEKREEILETINYAVNSKLHTASFSYVIPQPGTKLYSDALKAGYNFDNLSSDQFNPGDTSINISSVSLSELHKLRRLAYIKFYLNIFRIIRLFIVTPRKLLLLKSFFVFLSNVLPISITLRERIQGFFYR